MAIKELKTRLALKYDSYANWTDASQEGKGANLVLLAGEIGLCEIPSPTAQDPAGSGEATNAPTVLFKVGDGQHTFSELEWASALAADVYEWAKADTIVTDGEYVKFKKGNDVKGQIDLTSFAKKADVKDTTDGLDSRLMNVEAALGVSGGSNGNSVSDKLEALDARLDTIESTDSTKTGSIAKAAADTLASAKSYTDTETAKDRTRLTNLETASNTHTTNIGTNTADIAQLKTDLASEVTNRTKAVGDLETAYKAVDKTINDKIGGSFNSSNTVAKAIEDAKAAGTTAQNQVSALENGVVKTNTTNIGTNTSDIAQLKTDLASEVTNRTNADSALDTRLTKVEAFFTGADHDGKESSLMDALDTLVEIQDYITTDGAAADEMVKDIQANADAIAGIQAIVNTANGTLTNRVAQAEADIDALEGRATDIEAVIADYSKTDTIKKAVDAVSVRAEKGITDAATADGKAVTAQNIANEVKEAVEHTTTGLAATKKIADDNASEISGLKTRVETAEGSITTIQSIVSTGADSNTNLRAAITDLQTLTSDASKGNEKLRTDLTALTNTVNDSATGLAATHTIATNARDAASTNASKIAAIEEDYLRAVDEYIFNCGSASTVVHKQPAQSES